MSDPVPRPPRMTSEEFLRWAMEQPEGTHYELEDGVVVSQAAERLAHAETKGRIYRRLFMAVSASGLPCSVFTDGMAVRVDATTVLEPDCMVRCGPALPDDTVFITDPLVVVEVRSNSTASRDSGTKLESYFRLASARHYLIVRTDRPTLIHHARAADGTIATRIVTREGVRLDPPGITLGEWWPGTD